MAYSSFGAWVRQRRRALGLTQSDLAEQVGCSSEMIRKVETDKRRPSAQIAELLARALEIAPAERAAFLRAARLARREDAAPAAEAQPQPRAEGLPPAPELFGRAELLAELHALLLGGPARLVTLAGPAGVGKTSLAYAAAAQARPGFADGAQLVALENVEQAERVLPSLAEALGLPQTGQAPLDQLIGHLRGRRMLLVLDNLEQVAAVAPELAALLAACPRLVLLATSRVPLRAPGEQIVTVPPLELPPADSTDPSTCLSTSSAALFVARARAARPDFALTPANAGAVAAICRQMDGLPLAIELVAARSGVLGPAALLERLTGGHGYAPLELPRQTLPAASARHQTLRAAIGWSVDLLSESEQLLFRWLGAFSGGFSLAAAESVCGAAGLRPPDVLDGLQALLDAHLIARQPSEGDALRFGMLTTIREYALERLAAAGEHTAAQAANASYWLASVQELRARLQGPGQEAALDELEREHDNLRAALRWTLGHAPGQAAELGAGLWWFWYVRTHWQEGHAWLEQIVARSEPLGGAVPNNVRARLLRGAGALAELLARYGQAAEWTTQSLAISRADGNWQGMIATLNNLGGLRHLLGQSEESRRCFEEALELARANDRPVGAGTALGCLGSLATELGQFAEARRCIDESMALMRRLDYQFGVVSAALYGAELALAEHDDDRAGELFQYVLHEQRQQENWQDVGQALLGLGWLALRRGDAREALRLQREGLETCRAYGAHQASIRCLEGCAASLAAMGALDAARLYGAATAERERLGTPRQPIHRQALEPALERAANLYGPEAWAAAEAHGHAMRFEEAIALALV